ncbi:hypothetical protein ROHU_032089 [Labeo rohita]|uniref:Uncharacterized protein n=1 Tax=Labeo rohita TaxID=84645 RepID=A0A498LHT0_LABRO|nr:hypothetical protein ROHU_032089 [Labeo rohita]
MKHAQMDLRRLRTAESIKNSHIVPHSSPETEPHHDWTSITLQPPDIITNRSVGSISLRRLWSGEPVMSLNAVCVGNTLKVTGVTEGSFREKA